VRCFRDCYQRAEDCRRRAVAQADPELRKDFLELERRWFKLARNNELAIPNRRVPISISVLVIRSPTPADENALRRPTVPKTGDQ